MQRPPIPEYKPPKELQEELERQGNQQRKRTAVLPKRSWIQRNPRLFQIGALVSSMLIFFSKPLYDSFFEETFELPKEFEGIAGEPLPKRKL